MTTKSKIYTIAIMYGQNTEYWAGKYNAVNDCTTQNPSIAAHYESFEKAYEEMESVVIPFGKDNNWFVDYRVVQFID